MDVQLVIGATTIIINPAIILIFHVIRKLKSNVDMESEGTLVLECKSPFRYMGYFLIFIGFCFGLLISIGLIESDGSFLEITGAVFLVSLLMQIGNLLLLNSYERIFVDNTGIIKEGALKNDKVSWNDVEKIDINTREGMTIIKVKNRRLRIVVTSYYTNYSRFIRYIEPKLFPEPGTGKRSD